MKLARFSEAGSTRIGIVDDGGVLDISNAAPEFPVDMVELIERGEEGLREARAVSGQAPRLDLKQVRLEAPIARPPKILAIGLNYADHIAESGLEAPEFQIWFNKQSTCVSGPYDPIDAPQVSDYLDYEAELCFVIGRRCRHVPREEAGEVIFAYCVGNDVSVRDWQLRTPTMTVGKSFDTHGPLGPWLTTADEIADPHALDIKCWVNGELRQDSNTRHLIHDCFEQIEHLSTAFTLEPGDVIFTGTPHGVGGAMKPPRFLVPGDRVRIVVEKLGEIENPVRRMTE